MARCSVLALLCCQATNQSEITDDMMFLDSCPHVHG